MDVPEAVTEAGLGHQTSEDLAPKFEVTQQQEEQEQEKEQEEEGEEEEKRRRLVIFTEKCLFSLMSIFQWVLFFSPAFLLVLI